MDDDVAVNKVCDDNDDNDDDYDEMDVMNR